MAKNEVKVEWKDYVKHNITPMTPWVEGMDMKNISVGPEDLENGSPKVGDMIARDYHTHKDMWLVSGGYHEENYSEVGFESDTDEEQALLGEEIKTTWQERLLMERDSLRDKVIKLNDAFKADLIPNDQKTILAEQKVFMSKYLTILQRRVNNIPVKENTNEVNEEE